MADNSSLIDTLDKAAAALLARAFPVKSEGEQGDPAAPVEVLPLADQLKAFDTAVKWAKERKDLVPPPKEQGKVSELETVSSVRIGVEEVPVRQRPTLMAVRPSHPAQTATEAVAPITLPTDRPQQPSETKIIIEKPGLSDAMLAAFAAVGYAVSARLILLLALLGAFCLAVMALLAQSVIGLLVLTAYCLLAVIPMIGLELRGKRPKD